jgi:hypothetical protein
MAGATTALGGIGSLVSSAKNALSTGLSGLFGTPLGAQIPAPNILSNYASYSYVIGLSALSVDDINYPDISYKAGKRLDIICKSAGSDPENRIKTGYGKWDFFIDNLELESVIGQATASKTNTSLIKFDVYEPYSIGIFMLSLQIAAAQAGYLNWRDAPFLLSVEFRGSTESGQMTNIPFTTRHIPIKITSTTLSANEQGCRYTVSAFGTQGQAVTTEFANLKTDAAIKGKTVQEVLQTGKDSLQAIVNQALKEQAKAAKKPKPDEIVIIFPKEDKIPSGQQAAASKPASATTPTVSPKVTSGASDVNKKIGVSLSPVNKTLVQSEGEVNELGSQTMGYDYTKKSETSTAKLAESVTADGKWTRGNLKVDPTEGTLKFTQNMDIPSVIDQVLLTSEWAATQLAAGKVDDDGMRKWWRVDTQVYYIKTDENLKVSGTYPRIVVYRVLPYKAHSGAIPAPGSKPSGYNSIKRKVIKQYDYLYTGKNSEVIKFDIDFNVSFANVLASDIYKEDPDKSKSAQQDKTSDVTPNAEGKDSKDEKQGGYGTVTNKFSLTQTALDLFGGDGFDDARARIGRTFLEAIRSPLDMMRLNLEIQGDPYWIVNSGQGNYTSTPVNGVKDLNKDGSVNWQTSEVDIIVNFRSPFDINQTTGMYDFKSANIFDIGSSTSSGPTLGFTGLYRVNTVTSTFKNGVFKQRLVGSRRPLQELTAEGASTTVINTSTPKPDTAGSA